MIARVVDRRLRRRSALLAGMAGFLATILVIVDETVLGRTILHAFGTATARAVFAALLAVPSLSPLLVRAQNARRADARLEALGPADVRGLSLARAERGWSLAIEQQDRAVWFVELESLSDARRLVRRLRAGRASVDGVSIPIEVPGLSILHWMAACASLGTALFYVARHNQSAMGFAMAFAFTSAVMVAIRVAGAQRHDRQQRIPVVFDERTAWGRHARLHLAGEIESLDALERSVEAPARALARGDAATRAWLARIDELGSAKGGGMYRDGLDEAALRAIAVDEDAPMDERMAAARLLKKRIGASVADDVKDEEARVRIAAAASEEDDAAERIDDLGPVFRIRRS